MSMRRRAIVKLEKVVGAVGDGVIHRFWPNFRGFLSLVFPIHRRQFSPSSVAPWSPVRRFATVPATCPLRIVSRRPSR